MNKWASDRWGMDGWMDGLSLKLLSILASAVVLYMMLTNTADVDKLLIVFFLHGLQTRNKSSL